MEILVRIISELIIFPREDDAVHSSSSLEKGIFPEAQSQTRPRIMIDQGIAMAAIWPKYSSAVTYSNGCIITTRIKNGVFSIMPPIERHPCVLKINDWAALPLLIRTSITVGKMIPTK